ncbi:MULTISPECIES: NADH dehydrogenase [Bacillus]|uniref:NADH dehydrogenase n=1 Tax=Bacillus TaxID=1386 RepID=UPI000955D5B9|nr:NADH dehydrogenase [Bacillus velezensis]ATL39874.1 hypothetical protein CQJ38_10230 [Bacillus velezensis]MBN7742869.1 hypothetical protein [Bacillus velezensis]MDR0140938.1 hypothetical protein [Bacillus velezensis]MEC1106385.1 hypothetical protein [Bacillus velezensis]MEC1384733.1 hypothetical protein [Bacillus velezensis]
MKNKLEKLLLEKGVFEFHIKEMKETANISEYPYELYYDKVGKSEKLYRDVPLKKIKGLGFRGTSGVSWFDHACYNGTDNIDIGRCEKAFEYLKKQSLEEFHTYYQHSPVKLIHYEDDDFYAVYGDGTHRTIWAKITGAPTIYAQVTRARKNPSLYKSYLRFKELESQINKYFEENDLSWGVKNTRYYSEILYKGMPVALYSIDPPYSFKRSSYSLNDQKLDTWNKQLNEFMIEFEESFRYRKIFRNVMKITPGKLEHKLFSFIEKISESWSAANGKARIIKQGFDMHCIDKKII